MASSSSYLYKNRYAIYCFQKRNPTHILADSKIKQRFRKSLKTRNKREAEKRSRMLLYVMDKLLEFYWGKSKDAKNMYARAQVLLRDYKALTSWEEADNFLAELDGYDNHCLDKLIVFENEVVAKRELQNNKDSLQEQVIVLTEKKIGSKKKLSEILELFITARRRRWKAQRSESNEHKDYRPKLNLFIEIVEDVAGYDLCKQNVSEYRDVLFKMPKNRNKNRKYIGKSVKQLLEMNLDKGEFLGNVTLQNHFTKVGVFLNWCAENGYTNAHLQSPLRKAVKINMQPYEHRDVFTDDDIRALFESKEYKQGLHKKASNFWVPLLGLFTGARENELCQLHVSDVQKDSESGIWLIDFCEDKAGDKSIKGSKRRQVPLHNQIIKLGFLDYLDVVKKNKATHVFPDLIKKRDGYAQDFSKWFNRTYRKHCKVGQGDEKRDFHSFRHTLTDNFKQRDVSEHLVCEITGHAAPVGIAFGRYGKPSDLKKRSKLLNTLSYDIDFTSNRKWNEHKFYSMRSRKFL